jgi:hypothetical protein
MDEAAMVRYIAETFAGVDVLSASGDSYFYYDPGRNIPHDRRMPFATLVTGDRHDHVSDLERPGVYRLNIGVRLETYRTLFGPHPSPPGPSGVVDTGHDFAALDRIMPHPVYAHLSWVCVLNPGDATLQTVRQLLAEAHTMAAEKYAKRASADK